MFFDTSHPTGQDTLRQQQSRSSLYEFVTSKAVLPWWRIIYHFTVYNIYELTEGTLFNVHSQKLIYTFIRMSHHGNTIPTKVQEGNEEKYCNIRRQGVG